MDSGHQDMDIIGNHYSAYHGGGYPYIMYI